MWGEAFLRLLSSVIRLMPIQMALFLGRCLGWLWNYLIPIRRNMVRMQIRRALGAEVDHSQAASITRRMFENLGMNLIEFLRIDPTRPEKTLRYVETSHKERLDEALAEGRGVLVLTAHFGNWDLLCCSQALDKLPLDILSKEIKPAFLNRFWMNSRKACGLRILPDRGIKQKLLDELGQGRVIGFVFDQHDPRPGAVVEEFFGMQAACTPGLAELALDSGAPVVPVFLHRLPGGRHRMKVGRSIPLCEGVDRAESVKLTTRSYNRVLEEEIRSRPDHWMWLHRRWKIDGTI